MLPGDHGLRRDIRHLLKRRNDIELLEGRIMKLLLKLVVFVLFPLLAVVVISNHIKDKSTSDYYAITSITGQVFIQYQTQYPDKTGGDAGQLHEMKSKWLPLTLDMKIGPGVSVKTEAKSSLDLLLDDGMVFRIKEATVLKINENPQGKTPVQVMLSQGKMMAHVVASKFRRISSSATYKLRVDTSNAVCGIRGTVFSVDHSPSSTVSNIAVLEGTANVFKGGNLPETTADLTGGIDVQGGKKVEVSKLSVDLSVQDITDLEKEALSEAKKLNIEVPTLERLNKAVNFDLSPAYNEVLVKIANYAMSNLSSAFINRSQFTGILPNKLQDIELASGTYNDPWGTEFLYVRLSDKKAILISAGPDKILHTGDDVFKYINL